MMNPCTGLTRGSAQSDPPFSTLAALHDCRVMEGSGLIRCHGCGGFACQAMAASTIGILLVQALPEMTTARNIEKVCQVEALENTDCQRDESVCSLCARPIITRSSSVLWKQHWGEHAMLQLNSRLHTVCTTGCARDARFVVSPPSHCPTNFTSKHM